jgi:hypothetical protein
MTLNAITRPAAREPGPLVTLVRCLMVAKADSIGFSTGTKISGAAVRSRLAPWRGSDCLAYGAAVRDRSAGSKAERAGRCCTAAESPCQQMAALRPAPVALARGSVGVASPTRSGQVTPERRPARGMRAPSVMIRLRLSARDPASSAIGRPQASLPPVRRCAGRWHPARRYGKLGW